MRFDQTLKDEVTKASQLIGPYVQTSPFLFSDKLTKHCGLNVWLKAECLHPTGSFKVRPAFYGMLRSLEKAREKGVVASSSGNFAQAVAYAAQKLNVRATIVMMEKTSPLQVERTLSYGAKVEICGNTLRERIEKTDEIEKQTHSLRLEPFNSLETVIADATLGRELLVHFSDRHIHKPVVLVPVSGGGLIAGVSGYLRVQAHVGGVQSSQSGLLTSSLKENTRVQIEPFDTKCDALIATQLGEVPYSVIKESVTFGVDIDESEIDEASEFLLSEHGLKAEPGALLSICAVLNHSDELKRKNPDVKDIICVITGRNC